MKLMPGDAFAMSHDGMTRSSRALDEAEDGDVVLTPIAR